MTKTLIIPISIITNEYLLILANKTNNITISIISIIFYNYLYNYYLYTIEVDIPKEPISRPVLGDFDNDGVTDVLILTEDAVLGYRLEVEVSSKGLVIATLILIFFAFIFFLSNIKILGVSERNTGNGGSSGNGNGTTGGTGSGGSGRSRFSLLRATDDGKLD